MLQMPLFTGLFAMPMQKTAYLQAKQRSQRRPESFKACCA
jgi:hypothetical protein